MLACPGGGQGEQEEEGEEHLLKVGILFLVRTNDISKEHLLKVRSSNLQPRNPSSPPSLPPHPPRSCNNKHVILSRMEISGSG